MTWHVWKLCKWIVGTDFRCYYHHSASHFPFCNLSFFHLSNENKNIFSAYFRQPSCALNKTKTEEELGYYWKVNRYAPPLRSLEERDPCDLSEQIPSPQPWWRVSLVLNKFRLNLSKCCCHYEVGKVEISKPSLQMKKLTLKEGMELRDRTRQSQV